MPVSWMQRVAACPNAPGWPEFCPGQKPPVVLVRDAVPVVSGARLIPSGAWKPGRLGRQSVLVSPEPVGVHDAPASGLVSPVFVIQVASHVPEMHWGHGAASLPVM